MTGMFGLSISNKGIIMTSGKVKIRSRSILEKYPPGTTKDQIDSGEVLPLEVIESSDVFDVEKGIADLWGLGRFKK